MTPTSSATGHSPFSPTLDELEILQQLELTPSMTVPQALRRHLPARLLEHGLVTKTAEGHYAITEAGRRLNQRSM